MTGSLNLGDNYQIEENSNGNLVVRDSTGTVVLKHADGTQDIETQSINTDEATIANVAARFKGGGGDQSIPSNTNTDVVDPLVLDFEHTAVAEADPTTGRITIQQDGVYAVSGFIVWDRDSDWSVDDPSSAKINAGPHTIEPSENHNGIQQTQPRTIPATSLELSNGDDIRLTIFQSSGSSKTVLGQKPRQTSLSVTRLG